MEITTLLCIIFFQNLIFSMAADGNPNVKVTQSELITANAGESVKLNCSFEADMRSITVKWTRGCNHSTPLTDQTCYNGRIKTSDVKAIIITSDSGNRCCEGYSILTIHNVTESDSGIYCCHITTARGQNGAGGGTRLEVMPTFHIEVFKVCVVVESIRIFCLIILCVLLGITLKKAY